MGIKYRKTIEDKIEKSERFIYYMREAWIGETNNIRSYSHYTNEEESELKIFEKLIEDLKECQFKEFEQKMDSNVKKMAGDKLEYINRLDLLSKKSQKLFAINDKDELFEIPIATNVFIYFGELFEFNKFDKVSDRKFKKYLKEIKKKNLQSSHINRDSIRIPEYPFIVIEYVDNKAKFDREYFEKVFLPKENKEIEKMSRNKMKKIEEKGKEYFYNEGIKYDKDFNIISDEEEENFKRIKNRLKRYDDFLEKEKVNDITFEKNNMSDYQEAKNYLLRNGFNWSDLKRMNKHKIYFEANSILKYKFDKANI